MSPAFGPAGAAPPSAALQAAGQTGLQHGHEVQLLNGPRLSSGATVRFSDGQVMTLGQDIARPDGDWFITNLGGQNDLHALHHPSQASYRFSYNAAGWTEFRH